MGDVNVPPIHIMAAADRNGGIGFKGGLPWKIPEDWTYFLKTVTRKQHGNDKIVWIIGRKTWEIWMSNQEANILKIDEVSKLTKSLVIIIMTRQKNPTVLKDNDDSLPEHCFASSWNEVLGKISQIENVSVAWNLGGPDVYHAQLNSGYLDSSKLYLTDIDEEFECDAFFPDLTAFGIKHGVNQSRKKIENCMHTATSTSLDPDSSVDEEMIISYEDRPLTLYFKVYKFIRNVNSLIIE
eukprot:TRINITY_DN26147_c0_g1_i1.p1 TRINITY_DN26147_c0_g1~~TRINITY_DN26147_c0_g1_i1.p1  ORF type:complete len:239 (+),score=27.98 TRINITY_DN26147_c0_g1_i1:96-812(+)